MAIYTKKGDSGRTDTFSGKVMDKDDFLIEACGTVDELNAVLGLLSSFSQDAKLNSQIEDIQQDLFLIGAELTGSKSILPSTEVSKLELWIDKIESDLPPLHNFILPGGRKTASLLHLSRTICRRAERRVVSASKNKKIGNHLLIYLNRLSDFLFVAGRMMNYKKKVEDKQWKGKKLL